MIYSIRILLMLLHEMKPRGFASVGKEIQNVLNLTLVVELGQCLTPLSGQITHTNTKTRQKLISKCRKMIKFCIFLLCLFLRE